METYNERKRYFQAFLRELAIKAGVPLSEEMVEMIADLRARLWGRNPVSRISLCRGDLR